jgi:hypothetical protein
MSGSQKPIPPKEIPGHWQTRKERIRSLDTHFHLVLSWAARGGDAVCGKLVNEIVGIADVINDLYAGPRPMLPKSGSCGTIVGAGCDCRPAQHWISSLNSRSLSPCLAEVSRMLPRNKYCSFSSCLAKAASCKLLRSNRHRRVLWPLRGPSLSMLCDNSSCICRRQRSESIEPVA